MFDATGSYVIPFSTVAAVSFIGAASFLFLGEPKPMAAAVTAPAPSPA